MIAENPVSLVEAIIDTVKTPVAVFEVGPHQVIRYVTMNHEYEAVAGFRQSSVAGKRPGDVLPVERARLLLNAAHECLRYHQVVACDEPLWADDQGRLYRMMLAPVRAHDGEIVRLLATGAQRVAGEALGMYSTANLRRLSELVHGLPAVVWQWREAEDGSHGFTYVSDSASPLLGVTAAALLDDWSRLPLPPRYRRRWRETLRDVAARGRPWGFEGPLHGGSACIRWVRGAAQSAGRGNGETLINGLLLDATHEHELEQTLRHQASTDPLTGLMNRRRFFRAATRHLNSARRADEHLTLFIADLDHFKAINDEYGHAVGDAVLRHAATIISSHVRDTDLVCRLGGEEFAGLLTGLSPEDAVGALERLRTRVAEAGMPLGIGTVRLTLSIGVATCPHGRTDLKEFLARADRALYNAKRAGRNQVSTVC